MTVIRRDRMALRIQTFLRDGDSSKWVRHFTDLILNGRGVYRGSAAGPPFWYLGKEPALAVEGRGLAFGVHHHNAADTMRTTGTLVWRDVAGKIEHDIRSATFPSDERMPSEPVLATRYGVNRHTLRHAVGYLAEQGVLEVRHGKGTFIKRAGLDYLLTPRTRFTEVISKHAQRAAGRLVRSDRLCHAEAAAMLGVEEARELVLLEVLHSADGEPLALSEHYLPLPRFDRMHDEFMKTSSITVSLLALGVDDYVRGTTRLHSRLPTNREARNLRQSRRQPIVSMRYTNFDHAGAAVEYCVSRFSAERVQFVFDLKPDP